MNVIRIGGATILSLLFGIAGPAYAQHDPQDQTQDHPQEQQRQDQNDRQQHGQQQRQDRNDRQQHAQQQRQDQNDRQQHTQQQRRQDQNDRQQNAQQQRQDQNDRQQHAQQQRQDQNDRQQHAQQQRRQDQNDRQQHAEQRRYGHPQRSQEQQRVRHSAWQEHRSQRWDSDHRNWQQRGGYNGYRIPDNRYRGYFGRDHRFRIYGLPFMVVGGYPRFQYQGYWISLIDPWPEYWGNNWYDNDDVYIAYVDNGYYLYNRRYPTVGLAINISM